MTPTPVAVAKSQGYFVQRNPQDSRLLDYLRWCFIPDLPCVYVWRPKRKSTYCLRAESAPDRIFTKDIHARLRALFAECVHPPSEYAWSGGSVEQHSIDPLKLDRLAREVFVLVKGCPHRDDAPPWVFTAEAADAPSEENWNRMVGDEPGVYLLHGQIDHLDHALCQRLEKLFGLYTAWGPALSVRPPKIIRLEIEKRPVVRFEPRPLIPARVVTAASALVASGECTQLIFQSRKIKLPTPVPSNVRPIRFEER